MSAVDEEVPSGGHDTDAARRLAFNDFVYRRLRSRVERLRRRGDPGLPQAIEDVAGFAWSSHPGRLTDGALENALLELGQDLTGMPASLPSRLQRAGRSSTERGSRTLHVASEVYLTGGHSRVLAKWLQRDPAPSPALILTRQPVAAPPFLLKIAEERGVPVTLLDRGDTILERARQLRALSAGFDRVVLHHHPDDAVPTIAYATIGGPPVAMFNHAHFWFSLGSGVSDMIINTLPYFRRLTEAYRYPRTTAALDGPFGLDPLVWEDVDKPDAKARLGLPALAPVAMSIGSEPYFAPFGRIDFFATLGQLLVARPDLHLLLVGVREDSPLVPEGLRATGRIRLTGPVADPRPYYRAADICLESFPMPSLGALTEAVAYGQAFPVPAYGERESPLRVDQQPIASATRRARSQADYVDYVCALLDDRAAAFEQAAALRRTLIGDDACFGQQFASLYPRIDALRHAPRRLPETGCAETSETLALASLTDPARAGATINALLPAGAAIAAHVAAAVAGHELVRSAALGSAARLARPLYRKLPAAVRARLRRH